jgi:23S rRNA (cytidine1920-2'-O)/16S rRNA (cytidine1409-2'-O)-methyltransferase
MKVPKKRLDLELMERGLVQSRELAKRLIMAGSVLVNGQKVFKPSTEVKSDDEITVLEKPKYVSRGGYKLEGAIKDFGINPESRVCLDVGSSTGGFTDCLLKHGAKLVYAVDVGHGQLDYSLRNDPRVILYEGVNARYLDELVKKGEVKLSEDISLVVVDVSFISLTKIILPVSNVVAVGTEFLVLVKPQFELEPKFVGKGGIVREEYHHLAIEKVRNFIEENNFIVRGVEKSHIKGTDGNQEYFIYFIKRG